MDDFAIRVDNVSKTFKLPREKSNSLKSAFVNIFNNKKAYDIQKALNDVSFDIKKGEFFGIVGRNGSGKSTLLKMLAGIYSPTNGNIQVNGTLTPFIELGVGFNPELTGRENVFLNGALLGFNRSEMSAMYNDIVDFAELKKFMGQKLKNYSSGMQVRLAFSIAIRAKSDILLLDEVLAVGDAAFQRKCFNYFGKLKEEKKTVIFISHDMNSVRKYCDRVAWIDRGLLKAEGDTGEVIAKYLELLMHESRSLAQSSNNQELPLGMSSVFDADKDATEISNVKVEDKSGRPRKYISDQDDFFYVKFNIKFNKDIQGIIPGLIITNEQGEFISASNSKWANYPLDSLYKKGQKIEVSFKVPNIYEKGEHRISLNVVSGDFDAFYGWENNVTSLNVERDYLTGAKANPKYTIEVKNITSGSSKK